MFAFILFYLLYMKRTHKTIYTMNIKIVRYIGSCRDEPLTQCRKSYNIKYLPVTERLNKIVDEF